MNQGKRNIVLVGFNEKEKERLEFIDIREKKESWTSTDLTHRFPKIVYVDTLKEARRHQGLILFIRINEDNLNFVEYDIKNRKKFRNYEYVFLVVNDKSKIAYSYQVFNIAHIVNGISNIAVINAYNLIYHVALNQSLKTIYEKYLENYTKKLSRIRLENVEKLKNYVIESQYIDMKAIAFTLNVSTKSVERYLIDMNFVYRNVGYDKENRQYYITK